MLPFSFHVAATNENVSVIMEGTYVNSPSGSVVETMKGNSASNGICTIQWFSLILPPERP